MNKSIVEPNNAIFHNISTRCKEKNMKRKKQKLVKNLMDAMRATKVSPNSKAYASARVNSLDLLHLIKDHNRKDGIQYYRQTATHFILSVPM